jgi:HlyD family secretion protein
MANKPRTRTILVLLVLLGILGSVYLLLSRKPNAPQYLTANVARREIRMMVNTNGIIEPADHTEIFAPIDALITKIQVPEGKDIVQGHVLIQLDSPQIRTALIEARAALLQAKRQAQAVFSGPAKEEVSAIEGSIAESEAQLEQQRKDLSLEESLYSKQATSKAAVETLRRQQELLQIRVAALKKRKEDLLERYSPQDKQLERERVVELTRQVEMLEGQMQLQSVIAPHAGIVYSLSVKPGSYVTKGQLLAQIYKPGEVRLRAYVDEPDLGRIEKGQQVLIEWDGLPNARWTGNVDQPATQVIALNNRSVGEVICSINRSPPELIPNLNVKVEITTARKTGALVVPRAAVFQHSGGPAVLIPLQTGTSIKPVVVGLVTPEFIEIVQGIDEGSTVILNPSEIRANSLL